MLACLVHQYSEIRDLISCPPFLSESCLFICNLCFCLHSYHFQYDPKKHLACMGDKSNCSVICTLFKIAFLGKWDERGECPFLWPLTSFPDRHTYSVHSVQYRLSSCCEQFYLDLNTSNADNRKHYTTVSKQLKLQYNSCYLFSSEIT